MYYHRFVVPIKIYPLHHNEFFHPLFLFDWVAERWEITKEVFINCNGFYLLQHTNSQMHMNMIISYPAVIVILLLADVDYDSGKLF